MYPNRRVPSGWYRRTTVAATAVVAPIANSFRRGNFATHAEATASTSPPIAISGCSAMAVSVRADALTYRFRSNCSRPKSVSAIAGSLGVRKDSWT